LKQGSLRSLFSVELLDPLAALLRLERKRCGRTGEEARNSYGLACLLAIAIVAFVDQLDRLLDFLQKLAFAVARAKLEGVFLFECRAVGGVGRRLVLAQM